MAGTAAGSTEAGSPTRARETAAARWSRAPRETRNRAGTGASCGSRHRHVDPERAQREPRKRELIRNYNSVETTQGPVGSLCIYWSLSPLVTQAEASNTKLIRSPEGVQKYYGLTENDR